MSKTMSRVGWGLSILPSLLLIFSGVMKLIGGEPMRANFTRMGLPASLPTPLGVVEILCVVLYLVPKTAPVGLGLLFGYLGGAVLTHLRLGEAFITPIIVGVVFAIGLTLRSERTRELVLKGA